SFTSKTISGRAAMLVYSCSLSPLSRVRRLVVAGSEPVAVRGRQSRGSSRSRHPFGRVQADACSLAQYSLFMSNAGDCAHPRRPAILTSEMDVSVRLIGPAMHGPSGRTRLMFAVPRRSDRMAMKDVSVVLTHGAWADGSSWARVVTALKAGGTKV